MLTCSPRQSLDWDRVQRWRHSPCLLPQACSQRYAPLHAHAASMSAPAFSASPALGVASLAGDLEVDDDSIDAATSTACGTPTPCLCKYGDEDDGVAHASTLLAAPHSDTDVNAAFWWHTTGATLLRLLRWAQYSPAAIERHAKLIKEIVCPALGPAPRFDTQSGDLLPAFESFMCDDHSPIEYGITWTDGKPCIRFSIEAIGSAEDLASQHGLNNLASLRLMSALESRGYGDFTSFKRLLRDATLQPEHVQSGSDRTALAASPLRSQIFVAFDLRQDGHAMVKAYLMPHLRALRDRTGNFQVMRQALAAARLDCGALERVAEYVQGETGLQEERRPQAVILSTDAVHDVAKARTKLYFRYPTSSFDEIINHLSLGGALPSTPWLQPLRRVWHHLFGVDPAETPALPGGTTSSHLTGGCLVYYDFLPHSSTPTAKVYLPVRHWAASDGAVARGMAELLESSGSGGDYASALECVHPLPGAGADADLETSRGRQNYVCLGQKSGGRFELSAYIGPMLFGKV